MGFVAACMAACLAAGMGLAVGLERTMTPPSLSDSSDAGNLALGSEEFDDVRSLNCLCSMVLRPVERLVFSPKER